MKVFVTVTFRISSASIFTSIAGLESEGSCLSRPFTFKKSLSHVRLAEENSNKGNGEQVVSATYIWGRERTKQSKHRRDIDQPPIRAPVINAPRVADLLDACGLIGLMSDSHVGHITDLCMEKLLSKCLTGE